MGEATGASVKDTVFYAARDDAPPQIEPVRLALIGAGGRSRQYYLPLLQALRPWARVVAVCDPVRENADAFARAAEVRPYHDIKQLVKDRPMEAAVVVTPIDSHHAISVYLSSHKVPNHVETQWATMLRQARDMVAAARAAGVVVSVAENFVRTPVDKFARAVMRSGYVGRVGRIFSYADHTGYHNNSRWIAMAGAHPLWVQSIDHTMAHAPHYSDPARLHRDESLRARAFGFPDGFLVMDVGSGHAKGHLGRLLRPGLTEWHGERGSMVHMRQRHDPHAPIVTELYRLSDERLALAPGAGGGGMYGTSGGFADQMTAVKVDARGGVQVRIHAATPLGTIEHTIPFAVPRAGRPEEADLYLTQIVEHLIDFALAVRGVRPMPFSDGDALMSQMMEIAARESDLNEGRRVRLPLEGDVEADAIAAAALRAKFGVDPMDVEGMLAISYPRP